MRPVVDCRNAAVREFGKAEHHAVVKIIGRIDRSGRPFRRVIGKAAVGNEVAAKRAPHMGVGIDEAWHHDHPRSIDDLGAIGIETSADLCNGAVADEDIGPRQCANSRIYTDDRAAPDQIAASALQWNVATHP